jgi:hypothetical protein
MDPEQRAGAGGFAQAPKIVDGRLEVYLEEALAAVRIGLCQAFPPGG